MGFHPTTDYLPGDAGGVCFFCRSAQRDVYTDNGPRKELLFRVDTGWDGDVFLCAEGHPLEATCADGHPVDTDLDRGQGNVVVCETCLTEAALAIGFTSPDDEAQHSADVLEARTRADEAEDRAAASEELLAAIRRYDDSRKSEEVGASDAAATFAHDGSADAGTEPADETPKKRGRTRKTDTPA